MLTFSSILAFWKINPVFRHCWKGNLLMLSLILIRHQTFLALCTGPCQGP